MPEIETKELSVLKGQVSKAENAALALVVDNQESYEKGVDIGVKLKQVGKAVKQQKELITRPLNDALKAARDFFNPIESQFDSAELIVKNKLLAYKRKKDEEARIEEERLAARVEKGTMKIETAEKKIDAIERVENTTRGKTGESQIRKVKKVRIVDEALIPRNYLVPEMVLIRKDALAGVAIPGTEVYEEESMALGSL